jgi:hypothetical protein
MAAAAIEVAAIHLAVLGDVTASGADRVCGVLAYDGHGRRHLHPITPMTPGTHFAECLGDRGPRQLQLQFGNALQPPTSSGRTWRTWVLPTVPTSLRTLPPERLAAAFADQLLTAVAS